MRNVLSSSMLLATMCGLLGGCGGSGSGGGANVQSYSGTLGNCNTPGDIANCEEATYTAMGSVDPAMALRSTDQAACTPGSTYTAGQLCARANAVGFCTTTDMKTLPDGTTYTKKTVLISYPPGFTTASAQKNCANATGGVFSATAP